MDQLDTIVMLVARLVLATLAVGVALLPAWWFAGKIQHEQTRPFFRGLIAAGLALVAYLTWVNLAGRMFSGSIGPVLSFLAACAFVSIALRNVDPEGMRIAPLAQDWRNWIGSALLALFLALPQWILAVSSPYWDEVASSAIHVTAANQFAEGVFPPRHNAFPDIPIKYHYAFTILSGSTRLATGLSANVSIDVASTLLWLFAFLFSFHWFRHLRFDRLTAAWGSVSILLGGSLSWMFLERVEAYSGFEKNPDISTLTHSHDASKGWLENLLQAFISPTQHIRNPDGTLSNLPWDIAAQFQQHAVAAGLALSLVCFYAFVRWHARRGPQVALYIANVIAFSLLFLGHAVFGAVAAVSAGLVLLGSWLMRPSTEGFLRGALFTLGVTIVGLAHGGLLAMGAEYGTSTDLLTWRGGFGFSEGGIPGFLRWNIAGFGLPLVLAVAAWAVALATLVRRRGSTPRAEPETEVCIRVLFVLLTVYTAFSYLVPQLAFYSSQSSRIEQSTEIVKFFFPAHLGFALLSAFGIAAISRRIRPWIVAVGVAAMAVTPLAFITRHSMTEPSDSPSTWLGFYRAPYFPNSVEQHMAEGLGRLKHSNRDVYFDASAHERKRGYLNEMLFFGGSVFTLTPSRYERTGVGYRLSEQVVASRFIANGRMTLLAPDGPALCECQWYYAHPFEDMGFAPLLVRSRQMKALSEGYLSQKDAAGRRVLYSIDKDFQDIDAGLQRYWRPRVVTQLAKPRGNDSQGLVFFDLANHRFLIERSDVAADGPLKGERVFVARDEVAAPPALKGKSAMWFVGRFPGHDGLDFLFGNMKDTLFRHGRSILEIVERNDIGWTYRDSDDPDWQGEYDRWYWSADIPFVASIDGGQSDSHLAYRFQTSEWFQGNRGAIAGPRMEESLLPVPFAGRFTSNPGGDLGLWSPVDGSVRIQGVESGESFSFASEARSEHILVPADYDGDGIDEFGTWNRSDQSWSWRGAAAQPPFEGRFGSSTSVPVPADYDRDGKVDLAVWEPAERKIYVSYGLGRTLDLVIVVPPDSVPAYVNMH